MEFKTKKHVQGLAPRMQVQIRIDSETPHWSNLMVSRWISNVSDIKNLSWGLISLFTDYIIQCVMFEVGTQISTGPQNAGMDFRE